MTYQLTLSALNKKGGGMGAASMSYQASTKQWNTAVYFTSPERHSTQSSSQTSEMPILTNEDHGILIKYFKESVLPIHFWAWYAQWWLTKVKPNDAQKSCLGRQHTRF